MQLSQTIAMEIWDSWQLLQTLKVNCAFLAKFPIKKKNLPFMWFACREWILHFGENLHKKKSWALLIIENTFHTYPVTLCPPPLPQFLELVLCFVIFTMLSWHCAIRWWCLHVNKCCHHWPIRVDLILRAILFCGVIATIVTQVKDDFIVIGSQWTCCFLL